MTPLAEAEAQATHARPSRSPGGCQRPTRCGYPGTSQPRDGKQGRLSGGVRQQRLGAHGRSGTPHGRAVPRTCGPSTGAIRPCHSRSGRAWEGARFLHTTHILQEGDQPAAAPAHIPSKWSSPNQEGKTERWLAKTNEHAKQARRSPRPPEAPSPPHGQGLPPSQSDPAECPRASAARPGAASAGGLKDYVAIYLPLGEKTLSALRLSATGN
ncbi:hypothetical protein R6Z07F_012241 [Ovis aries]